MEFAENLLNKGVDLPYKEGMPMSYKKLWKMLIDRDMKKSDLMKIANISSPAMAKLGKDENVQVSTLAKICSALNCDIGDICEYIPESEDERSVIQKTDSPNTQA